jgi:hypothetical protein
MSDVQCVWCGAAECDCEERIECSQAGEIGHMACGWCDDCDAPMFQCLHSVRNANAAKTSGD